MFWPFKTKIKQKCMNCHKNDAQYMFKSNGRMVCKPCAREIFARHTKREMRKKLASI